MRAAGKRRWLIMAVSVAVVLGGCRGADGALASALINTGIALGSAAAAPDAPRKAPELSP